MSCKFKRFFKTIPVNYPIGVVYLNGVAVEVANFSNLSKETGLAFFLDADGQITVLDTNKIDGVAFGQADPGDETDGETC